MKNASLFWSKSVTDILGPMAVAACAMVLVSATVLEAHAASSNEGNSPADRFPQASPHAPEDWAQQLPGNKREELQRLIAVGKARMNERRSGKPPTPLAVEQPKGTPKLIVIGAAQEDRAAADNDNVADVFSDEWFRANFDDLKTLAHDNPSEENVRRWLIARRILAEKQRLFEESTRRVLNHDPSLRSLDTTTDASMPSDAGVALDKSPVHPDKTVPEHLREWAAWSVRGREGHRNCTWTSNGRQTLCAWPGQLTMSVDTNGADFSIDWETQAPTWLGLPGDQQAWPMLVMDGVDSMPISDKDGRPSIWVAHAGTRVSHLSGRIVWNERPESIQLPDGVALFEITVDGNPIDTAQVDEKGQLWLHSVGEADTKEEAKESERVQVYRLVHDGQPMILRTHIALDIAGKNRSLGLSRVLPEGFLPMGLISELPARVDLEGNVELQVRPGRWVVELIARSLANVERLAPAGAQLPWPAQEVWAFTPAPEIRTLSVQGATEIAPDQSGTPQLWSGYRTFLLEKGDALELTQLQRGRGDARADSLSMERKAWLDFDGEGLTVHDRIIGAVDRPGRLEAGEGLTPGEILVDELARYLTKLSESGREGIDIDQGPVSVTARGRLTPGADNTARFWPMHLPVSGWNKDFDAVDASLELPPGWTLIEVDGVDSVRGAWLREWSLVDIFFVIVTIIVVARLYGMWLGVLSAAVLVLTWHSMAGLQGMWLSFALLGALRVAVRAGSKDGKSGGWRGLLDGVTLLYGISLVISSFVLAGGAVQSAMFPQLSDGNRQAIEGYAPRLLDKADSAPTNSSATPYKQSPRFEDEAFQRIDPEAKLGTGPGTPQWSWRSATLRWRLPAQGQQVALYALTPAQTRIINLLQAVLVLSLSSLLFLMVLKGRLRATKVRKKRKRKAAAVLSGQTLVVLLAATSIQDGLSAEVTAGMVFPPDTMLKQLGDYLTQPPKCTPNCTNISQGWLRVASDEQGERLNLTLVVHAQEATALPILEGFGGWRFDTIVVDGTALPSRIADGVVWTPVPKGLSTLEYSGALPHDGRVTLQLPIPPKLMDVTQTGGWRVDGIEASGRTEGSITLTKVAETGAGSAAMTPSDMPPLVRVQRTLTLGVDWNVLNQAFRVAPTEGPVVVQVPLIPGERVVSEAVGVEDGRAVVTFANGETEKQWVSRLDAAKTIRLTASLNPTLVETWRLRVSEFWHAEPSGLTETTLGNGGLREWRPWAGETLEIDVTRPIGLDTRTVTIESARLEGVQGRHTTEYTLTLDIRASQGGGHTLRVPPQAQLLEVTVNELRHHLSSDAGLLRVNLIPGRQAVKVRWKQKEEIPRRYHTPVIDLGIDAVNAEVNLQVSSERWVLWTNGPTMGPAVRLWSRLALALVVIGSLAWWAKDMPLRLLGLVVLSIGITQATEAFTLVSVAVLLFWSKRYWEDAKPSSYNVLQVVLAFAALLYAVSLLRGVTEGLIGMPEMHIAGNGSSGTMLRWYEDRTLGNSMPQGIVVSVAVGYYRLLMLGWALLVAVFATVFGVWFWKTWKHPTMFRKIAPPRVMTRKTRPVDAPVAHDERGQDLADP